MKAVKMHENRNNNMESFYEENGQFVVTTAQSTRNTRNLKRPESLDLHLAINNNRFADKKARCAQSGAAVLATPDVNKMIWGTPDLEKYIMSLPTPVFANNAVKGVTNEQEEYAQPFVDALNNLRNSDNAQHHCQSNNLSEFTTAGTTGAIVMNPAITTTTSATTSTVLSKAGMSGGSLIYTNLDENNYPITIKDEPQTVPNSPPLSPINMENQEKIKLERKRQRNRVAASKCRKRKLERISKLEDKVKILKGENIELSSVIKSLKEHVMHLKQKVIEHINSGCSIPTYNTAYFVRPSKVTDSDIK